MKRILFFITISFCFSWLLSCGLLTGKISKALTSGKWYNDEYSFTFAKDSYKAFYTSGKTNGTMTGSMVINSGDSITINKGKLKGNFGPLFKGKDKIDLSFVTDMNNPKSTLYLADREKNIILWNDKSFVKADRQILIGDEKIKSVTTGYKLTSTTTNVRIRKGPGIKYKYMNFNYKDIKTNKVKSWVSVLEGTNIRILAHTVEKEKVGAWYNYWYYIEYKEPKGDMLVYKNAWMFGEFINVAENKNRQIAIANPANEAAVYGESSIDINGTVTGAPVKMLLQVKNSYGNVTVEKVIKNFEQTDGTFSMMVSKKEETLFIGSNIFNVVAVYSDDKKVSKQITVYLHEGGVEMAKPVIYLYPEEETDITVKVYPQNGFSRTEPAYNNGWEVTAKPDGTIINKSDGKKYPYLFWESEDYSATESNEGFVVKTGELSLFFTEKLAILGLNHKEIDDFLDFWIPILNKGNYYYIHFFDRESLDDLAPLVVDPEPDTVIRVFFDSKPLDNPVNVEEQELVKVERVGFTVAEWGGMRHHK